MIRRPREGQRVQLWYAAPRRRIAPHHGAVGVVAIVGRGPGPRNAGVDVGGRVVVVSGGNLRAAGDRP